MPNEDQHRAEVDQRTREAMAVELAALRADAERARWCESHGADVVYSDIEKLWWVQFLDQHGLFCETSHPDRNAAIDTAMKGGR